MIDKKEYVPVEMEEVKEINSNQRNSLLLKTVKFLPDNPSDAGMRASATKPKFYGFVTDSNDSMLAYHNFAIASINEKLMILKEKINSEFSGKNNQVNLIIDELTILFQKINEEINLRIENDEKTLSEANTYTYRKINQEITDRNNAISEALARLIDNSPEALDTLKEISDALHNDPNFATTITNLITEKFASATTLIEEEKNSRIAKLAEEKNAREKSDDSLNRRLDGILGTTGGTFETLEGTYNEACKYTNGEVSKANAKNTELEEKLNLEIQARKDAISNLINNSPEALDTLYELSQALGNDPNFATTILNTINFKDSQNLKGISFSNGAIIFSRNGGSSSRIICGTDLELTNGTINHKQLLGSIKTVGGHGFSAIYESKFINVPRVKINQQGHIIEAANNYYDLNPKTVWEGTSKLIWHWLENGCIYIYDIFQTTGNGTIYRQSPIGSVVLSATDNAGDDDNYYIQAFGIIEANVNAKLTRLIACIEHICETYDNDGSEEYMASSSLTILDMDGNTVSFSTNNIVIGRIRRI